MFYLSRIEHTLRLPPHLLSLRLEDAVRGELEKLFLDKVIANLGLCISVHTIQSIKDGFILPNDGHPTFRSNKLLRSNPTATLTLEKRNKERNGQLLLSFPLL